MIDIINDVIDGFLTKAFGQDNEGYLKVKSKFTTSITDNLNKGHITSNVCMIAAGALKVNPKELSNSLTAELIKLDEIESAESAGPGFINIKLTRNAFVRSIKNANETSKDYGRSASKNKKKIQIEFVSANPTGPLHVGHGRGAAYGDAIGRILDACGHDVKKEYYVNDAGRQIDILTSSVCLRLMGADNSKMPNSSYKGQYILDIADKFIDAHGKPSKNIDGILTNLPDDPEKEIDEITNRIKEDKLLWKNAKEISLDEVLCSIKEDLKNFNVIHDNWYYESSLGSLNESSSPISNAMNFLKDSGQAYIENGALWLDTSSAKDDKNRVLIREDERPTYFASDVAYHKNKIDRGFDKLINVWGADHHGYIKRIEASISGLGFNKDKLDVQLVQFANLFKDGKKVKMSTRSGDFYSLKDLIQDIGTDAARFYYLSKQADQHLDFDLNLATSDSKENMFYYIQYAHARIFSLLGKYKNSNTSMPSSPDSIINGSYKKCDKLIHEISRYPSILKRSSLSLHPHLIIFYLKDLAHTFHSFYNDNPVLTESEENLDSIILCLDAVKSVIANGFELLGIEPMEKM